MSRVSGERESFVSVMGERSLSVVDRYWAGREKNTQDMDSFLHFFHSMNGKNPV
jgi:aminoglycoside/choline kinase family phosphotransferase